MRLIVLKSLVALFYLGTGIMAVIIKSSGHFPFSCISWQISHTSCIAFFLSSTFLLEFHPLALPSRPSFLKLLLQFYSLVMLDRFPPPPPPLLLQSVSLLRLTFHLCCRSIQCMLSIFPYFFCFSYCLSCTVCNPYILTYPFVLPRQLRHFS